MGTQGESFTKDPLASPTLAALYASQGHADVAEAMSALLDREPAAGPPPGTRQRRPCGPAMAKTVIERLLSLREAARQARQAGHDAGGKAGG